MLTQNQIDNIVNKLLGQTDEDKLIYLPTNTGGAIGNFSEIREEAQQIADSSKDYTAILKDITAYCEPNNIKLSFSENNNSCISEKMHLMPFGNGGLDSICRISQGPSVGYIKKCMAQDQFPLAAENINYWLNLLPNQERTLLIRTTNDRVHGILSNKYTIFDDDEILSAVHDVLAPEYNYTVKNYQVNPENLRLRVINNDKISINGRDLSFGYEISNSRIGKGCAKISVMVFDWICSNGMIFGGGKGLMYAKRHFASDRQEFIGEFVDMLSKAPDSVAYIKKNIEAAGNVTLNNESIQKYLDKFRLESAGNLNVIGKIKSLIDSSKYDKTLFGLAGAVTEVAQSYCVDTRIAMETFAGNILLSA